MGEVINHALYVASLGIRVFALHYPDPDAPRVADPDTGEVRGGCSCRNPDCTDQGKHPLTPHGLLDATVEEGWIRQWWDRWPRANVGARTGDGFHVLDVDPRHDGGETLSQLERQHGDLPETWEVETGSGGLHVWLRVAGEWRNTAGKLGAGLDTRGDGGYVVMPPSLHVSGRRYSWRDSRSPGDVEMALAPDWFLDKLRVSSNGKRAESIDTVIPEGKRNATLASLAGTMRRRGASEAAILAALRETNAQCQPPLPEDEVAAIAASIAGYAPVVEVGKPAFTGEPSAIGDVVKVFKKWLHLPDSYPLYAALGAVAANQLPGDPVWLGVIAPPSSAKTEILNALSMLPDVYPAATLTPASLLSGTPNRSKAADAKGGLLREIGQFGILVLKDFGSILSLRAEAKAEVLAALREVYDGSWTRHLGTDGGKTLHWQGKVGLVFGATPALDSYHSVTSSMGERFCLIRMKAAEDKEQFTRAHAHAGKHTADMRKELAEAVAALFARERKEPRELSAAELDELGDIAWRAVRIRSAVERDRQSREIESIHGTEGPARLGLTLERLLAGMDTLGIDRATAFCVIRCVADDSVPPIRRRALEYVEDHPGATTKAIAEALGYPTSVTRRALEDIACYKLVARSNEAIGGGGRADVWTAVEEAA